MIGFEPLDPFSEVVDERRRWTPDWYQWLKGLNSEGLWTPTITFATPGDLSVGYAEQAGAWVQMGRTVFAWFTVITSSFTHGSASGEFRIGGLPFACRTIGSGSVGQRGSLQWQGITKANYTDMVLVSSVGNRYMSIRASGSGQTTAIILATDMPTGGTVDMRGFLPYLTV